MQKLITDICWTRHGVDQFTARVNQMLYQGWKVCNVSIEKRGFRFVCHAVLILKPEVAAEKKK